MAYIFNPFTGSFDSSPTVPLVDGLYLPLSGGTLTGPLSCTDSVYVEGAFEAGSGATVVLFVDNNLVGVNTETPNESLTIVGNVSATGTFYSAEGSSVNWQEAYTNLVSNSAAYLSSVDLSFLSVSANWESTYTTVGSNSANWESTYNTVSALSASWSAADEILVAEVTNADSVTLNRGDVVYTFGATGSVMSVKLASNSAEATSSKTLGIINETIIPNGIGYATVAGRIDKMSFPSPFVDGDALWLGSTPGTFTRVKPIAPNHLVYLGVIERANNGNGIAYTKVQNGYELDEIHDVLINGIQAGDLLQRNSSNTLWINGPLSADGSNITSGTIAAARMPTFNGDITATTTNGSVSAKVVAIQGEPVSTQVPVDGQVLQWNGTAWTPGSLPQGGSGGGGIFYFLNQALSAEEPTTNLPLTAHELGRAGLMGQTTYTSPDISQVAYTKIAGFVTNVLDPNINSIPGGIWDFNIWGYSNANPSNPTLIRAKVYMYDGSNSPVLISTSDDTTLTDSGLFVQHKLSCLIPQTSAALTDRIYIELEATASAASKTVTLGFGDSTPSHIHTTIPSVGGSGLVKVIDGVTQSPASLLVDADVASNANIAQSKINGLTDLASQSSSTYTTVNTNSADWSSAYSTVQSNSATTWNYQGTDLKALSGNWQTTYLASSAYVVSDPTGITGASALTKLIQITQAGYNAIITPSSDTLYVIVG